MSISNLKGMMAMATLVALSSCAKPIPTTQTVPSEPTVTKPIADPSQPGTTDRPGSASTPAASSNDASKTEVTSSGEEEASSTESTEDTWWFPPSPPPSSTLPRQTLSIWFGEWESSEAMALAQAAVDGFQGNIDWSISQASSLESSDVFFFPSEDLLVHHSRMDEAHGEWIRSSPLGDLGHGFSYPYAIEKGAVLAYDPTVYGLKDLENLEGLLKASQAQGKAVVLPLGSGYDLLPYLFAFGNRFGTQPDGSFRFDIDSKEGVLGAKAIETLLLANRAEIVSFDTSLGIGDSLSDQGQYQVGAKWVSYPYEGPYPTVSLPGLTIDGIFGQWKAFSSHVAIGVSQSLVGEGNALAHAVAQALAGHGQSQADSSLADSALLEETLPSGFWESLYSHDPKATDLLDFLNVHAGSVTESALLSELARIEKDALSHLN